MRQIVKSNSGTNPLVTALADTGQAWPTTDPAYIAWGCYLYLGLQTTPPECSATLSADGNVTATKRCKIVDVERGDGKLAFTRLDEILPILPPGPLPPRQHVPLEKVSPYLLRVTGLPAGKYEVRCEGKRLGVIDAAALAEGVNFNTVLLDSKEVAPWEDLAKQLWTGKESDHIAKTRLRFELHPTKT